MRLLAKRTLAIFLSVLMVLSVMMVGTATAFAGEETNLFLSVSSDWATAGPRFAAYFFEGETANTWVDMTAVEGKENLYTVTVPEGNWTNVIFCRMNPAITENGWNPEDGTEDNKKVWNQTVDIAMPTDSNNCFVLDAGWGEATEGKVNGVWGTYADDEIVTQPTESVAPTANVYTVAGSAGLCGSDWDTTDANNNMTDNGDGTYTKVYENVAAGTYGFKVVINNDWANGEYGNNGADFSVTVNTSATVTITLNVNDSTVTFDKTGDTDPVAVEGSIFFVNTFGWDPVNAHHWDANNNGLNTWPGDYATVENAEKGVYSFNVTGAVGVVFNCNGDNTKQTADIAITADVIGKYYEPKTNAFYNTADEAIAAADVPVEPVESNYVNFVNTVGWEYVNVHCWGGSVDTQWPGNPATLVEGTDNVYTYDIGNSTGFIFNYNGDENKTGNLDAVNGINKYYEPKTAMFYDTAEAAIEAGTNAEMKYFVVASEGLLSVGAWVTSINPETTMTKLEDGTYKIVLNDVKAGFYEVKVMDTLGKWYPEGIDTETEVTVLEDGAEVVITFNPDDNRCYASVTGQEVVAPDYVIVGYINGADLGINEDSANVPENTKFKDSKVTIEFTQDSYIQIKTSNNNAVYGTAVCEEGATSAVFSKSNNEKMKIPAGIYTFTLIENADGTLTVSYVPAEDPSDPSDPTDPTDTEPTTETQPAPKTTITLKKSSGTVYVTGKIKVNATVKNGKGSTKYTTSNKKIATVDSKGNVKGIKAGTAKITVTNNGVKKTFKVTVKKPTLNVTKKVLKKNKSFTLKVTGLVGKAKFTTSNKKVATVSSKGKVTAKKKGTATITVTANGMKLKCKVTVK